MHKVDKVPLPKVDYRKKSKQTCITCGSKLKLNLVNKKTYNRVTRKKMNVRLRCYKCHMEAKNGK
jgi:hypothetical protein